MAARLERLLHALQNSANADNGREGNLWSSLHVASVYANYLCQLAALEKEVKERSQKETQKEQQEADQPIINPGFNRLMLTNGYVYA